jgi:hypothetical protein
MLAKSIITRDCECGGKHGLQDLNLRLVLVEFEERSLSAPRPSVQALSDVVRYTYPGYPQQIIISPNLSLDVASGIPSQSDASQCHHCLGPDTREHRRTLPA